MTDDDFPAGVDPAVARAAAAPLDETDEALLGELGRLLSDVDPVPEDLVSRIQFSLALDEVFAEVALLTRVPMDSLAVRSDPAAGVRTETLTFSADRLTAMVTVTRSTAELLRVDGWIAPPGAMRVQLRMQEGSQEVVTDDSGRFVFEGVPEGFAQLTFRPADTAAGTTPDGAADADAVVTPLFQL